MRKPTRVQTRQPAAKAQRGTVAGRRALGFPAWDGAEVESDLPAEALRAEPAELPALAEPEVRGLFARSFRAAVERGAGGVSGDLALLVRPWDFDPADIALAVGLWHGDADRTVPPTHARRLAAAGGAFVFRTGDELRDLWHRYLADPGRAADDDDGRWPAEMEGLRRLMAGAGSMAAATILVTTMGCGGAKATHIYEAAPMDPNMLRDLRDANSWIDPNKPATTQPTLYPPSEHAWTSTSSLRYAPPMLPAVVS